MIFQPTKVHEKFGNVFRWYSIPGILNSDFKLNIFFNWLVRLFKNTFDISFKFFSYNSRINLSLLFSRNKCSSWSYCSCLSYEFFFFKLFITSASLNFWLPVLFLQKCLLLLKFQLSWIPRLFFRFTPFAWLFLSVNQADLNIDCPVGWSKFKSIWKEVQQNL